MKNTIHTFVLSSIIFVACSPSSKEENQQPKDEAPEVVTQSFAASEIINEYLKIKNALADDNSAGAAEAGKMMVEAFNQFKKKTIPADRQIEFNDIFENALEQAEHISANSGNIAHQREHLAVLSKDFNDLIAITGTDRTLYQTFCPMYDHNKGAIWLSEIREIKNPFFGSKMSTCGKIQTEITVR